MDASEEFKVMTNTYDAQHGRTMGGIVNMTLKSGTNALHGSLYDYLRNSVLDANTFQNNLAGLSKGSHVFNDFGAMAHGPIRQEKAFFMGSYEGIREKTPFPRTSSIPTMLEREGNFSQSQLNVFDPLSTRENPAFDPSKTESASNPRYVRSQFAGNVLPASRLHPVARNVLGFLPPTNLPGRFNNYLASPNNGIYNYNSYIGRVDLNLTASNRLFASYNYWHRDELRNSSGLPGVLMQGNYMQQRTVNALVLDWVAAVSPTLVYSLRVSGNRFVENDDKRQNQGFEFAKLGSETAVRAGAGFYYYQSGQFGTRVGFTKSTSYITGSGKVGIPEQTLNTLLDPFPRGVAAPPGSSEGIRTNIGHGVGFDRPSRRMPRALQFPFGLQRDLPSRMNLDVSYVGSRTHQVTTSHNINDIPLWAQLKGVEDTMYLSRQIPNPFLGIAPATTSLGSQATIGPGAFLRAFPQFSGFSRSSENDGKYWFNSLQVKVDKRLAHGLSVILSYTFSRAMRQDEYKNSWSWDGKPTRTVSDVDTPHNVAFSGLYQLPFGAKKRFLGGSRPAVRALLGGWDVQGILTYASGRPIGITGAEYSGIPVKGVQHRWVTTPSGVSVMTWFNTYNIDQDGNYNPVRGLPTSLADAVAVGSPFYQRTPNQLNGAPLRFSALRTPAVPQLNLSLIKDTRIRERATLQFRAESFNTANSPLFAGPNTGTTSRELFGTVGASQLQFSRNVQFGLKLLF